MTQTPIKNSLILLLILRQHRGKMIHLIKQKAYYVLGFSNKQKIMHLISTI